jgi:4-hydroxyproline epimerase
VEISICRVAYGLAMKQVRVIDSHTEGEPTRLIIEGGPNLGFGTMSDRLHRFRETYDGLRSAVVNEPRGSEAVVGAILCEPVADDAAAGVIFFNNVGFLGMCGHGTIGLVASLAHLKMIQPGVHRIETPVGDVSATLAEDGSISIANVVSYRYKKAVSVDVAGYGTVIGDIAYGGNWFFLVGHSHVPVLSSRLEDITHYAKAIKAALVGQGITGESGAEIDHVEIFGDPQLHGANSKNYVLCPGGAYDRSPCGTGLSAKLACLAADGKLAEGEEWRQESIIGTLFRGRYAAAENGIHPTITARAYVTADSTLIFDDNDPLREGIRL